MIGGPYGAAGSARRPGTARGRGVTVKAGTDERLASTGLARRLLIRPELGAVVGAIVVFVFFASQSETFRSANGVANWLDPASTLGIMAVAIALLMIGGEFDLSAGVLTGTTGLITVILSTRYGLPVWAAMLVALVAALLVGFLNGMIVVRTNLPSFIVTLGTFLMLQGINLGVTKALTGTVQVGGLRRAEGYEQARAALAGTFTIGETDFRVAILWWLGVTALATWVLMRTRAGNWIFAVGGDDRAARAVGVPAERTKIALFMTTATAAWLVGSILALRFTSVQANAGLGQEFVYIIAAVIGAACSPAGTAPPSARPSEP
nr:ABC transporter permease [Planobispora longispora]